MFASGHSGFTLSPESRGINLVWASLGRDVKPSGRKKREKTDNVMPLFPLRTTSCVTETTIAGLKGKSHGFPSNDGDCQKLGSVGRAKSLSFTKSPGLITSQIVFLDILTGGTRSTLFPS